MHSAWNGPVQKSPPAALGVCGPPRWPADSTSALTPGTERGSPSTCSRRRCQRPSCTWGRGAVLPCCAGRFFFHGRDGSLVLMKGIGKGPRTPQRLQLERDNTKRTEGPQRRALGEFSIRFGRLVSSPGQALLQGHTRGHVRVRGNGHLMPFVQLNLLILPSTSASSSRAQASPRSPSPALDALVLLGEQLFVLLHHLVALVALTVDFSL